MLTSNGAKSKQTQSSPEDQAVSLLQQARYGEPDFERALSLLDGAIEAGSAIALHIRGDVYLQNPQIHDSASRAVDCYRLAAKAGLPESVYRLADCCLRGHGVPQDDARATSLIEQLARQALPDAMVDLAYLIETGLGCPADPIESSSWLLRAAAMGHTTAFRLLSERYRQGHGVPQSDPLAFAWLELARLRGFVDAARRMNQWSDELSADAVRQGQSTAEAIKACFQALPVKLAALSQPSTDEVMRCAADNLRQIGLPAIDVTATVRLADTNASTAVTGLTNHVRFVKRATSPRVLEASGFISDEENILLLASTESLMKTTSEIRDASNHLEVDAFDGACAVLSANLTPPVVRNVLRRFAQHTGLPEDQFEPASVLRYGPGDEYSLHVDSFDAKRVADHEAAGDFGGQRVITALIYLIEPARGGQTHYPQANLTVACQRNTALLHYNADSDGNPDPASLHASLPVEEGEKWLFRTSARQFSLYPSE